MSVLPELVICETPPAIVPHLRVVTDEFPIRLSGHPFPRPRALCGAEVAWDTRIPVTSSRCRDCRTAHALMVGAADEVAR
jgi:hypothetical protein